LYLYVDEQARAFSRRIFLMEMGREDEMISSYSFFT
jgi:hypothetical protein